MGPLETVFDLGIIPADAGSTCRRSCRTVLIRDHPRGCGEHITDSDGEMDLTGSSPRMRGALRLGGRC